MSEIKGQLLGIILVLMVFGVVGGTLKSVFNGMADTVSETVETIEDDVADSYENTNDDPGTEQNSD